MESSDLKFPTFESFKVWFDEKTKDHPYKTGMPGQFYEEFVHGKMPMGLLREHAKQFYVYIQMINVNLPWIPLRYIGLWRSYPELYDLVAAKIGEELADPVPGGHGRTYLKYARYIGLKDEDLFFAKPTVEMETMLFNRIDTYDSARLPQLAVGWMMEGFAGYHLKLWRDTLHDKYNVPDDILEFFDIHVRADLEEHGPMGELLLARLYKLGLVMEQDYRMMQRRVERSVGRARGGTMSYWADSIHKRYYEDHPG